MAATCCHEVLHGDASVERLQRIFVEAICELCVVHAANAVVTVCAHPKSFIKMFQTTSLPLILLWRRDRSPDLDFSDKVGKSVANAVEAMLAALRRGDCGCAIINPTVPGGGVRCSFLKWSVRQSTAISILQTTSCASQRMFLCVGTALATGFVESETCFAESCDGTCFPSVDEAAVLCRLASESGICSKVSPFNACCCDVPAWYNRMMVWLVSAQCPSRTPLNLLVLGAGLCGIPLKLAKSYRDSIRIDVVDWDDAVLSAARSFHGDRFPCNVSVHCADANEFITNNEAARYDAVIIDLLSQGKLPSSVSSAAFLFAVKSVLFPHGFVLLNGSTRCEDFGSLVSALTDVFGNCDVQRAPLHDDPSSAVFLSQMKTT
jgi:hypothetical protein